MRGSLRGKSGKLRVAAGLLTLGLVVAAAATMVAASPGRGRAEHITAGRGRGKGRGATTTTTSPSTTTTGIIPYGLQSVALSGLTFTASKTSTTVSGSFVVTNTGDTPTVVVDSQTIGVKYKTTKNGSFTAMPDPSCTFVPAVPYTVVQQQSVDFTCQLPSAFPPSAQFAQVTATVTLLGSTTGYSTSAQQAI